MSIRTHLGRDPVLGIGGFSVVWWASSSIQYIDSVFYQMRPEANRGSTCFLRGPYYLHDRTDGSFGNTVELMHMRWTSGTRDGLFVEELGELVR